MNRWTMDNTESWTQPQLDMINAVRNTLMTAFTGDENLVNEFEKSIDDAITNSWQDGISRDELARETMTRLFGAA